MNVTLRIRHENNINDRTYAQLGNDTLEYRTRLVSAQLTEHPLWFKSRCSE